MTPIGFEDKVAFVWKVADKLRGTFKQHEYGSVMLPLLVLRRMDAVLAPTKQAVLGAAAGMASIGEGQAALLKKKAGHRFYNTSPLTFPTLLSDDKALADNLRSYIRKLSPEAYGVMEAYDFDPKLEHLDRAGLLYAVLADFADLDLRPSVVSNERCEGWPWTTTAARPRWCSSRRSRNFSSTGMTRTACSSTSSSPAPTSKPRSSDTSPAPTTSSARK